VREDVELLTAEGTGAPAMWNRRACRGKCLATSGLLICGTVLLSTLPACSSPSASTSGSTTSTSTSTSMPSSVSLPQVSAAEIAACQADARTLETALGAYDARNGAYPSPASAWSAADYAANFEQLTSAANGGPYLPNPPATKFYVIEYDSAGHVWIAPPGSYSTSYNPGQSFDANPNICIAAVG
jgi:hypothetical protein